MASKALWCGRLLAVTATLGLAACGGGGSSAGVTPAPSTPPPPPTPAYPDIPPTDAAAARFLTQASFGPTRADIARVRQIGYKAWIDEQVNASTTPMSSVLAHLQSVEAAGVARTSLSTVHRRNYWLWRAARSAATAACWRT